MNKYIITKVTLDLPKKYGRSKHKKLVDELKERVYSDSDKDSLVYYLAAELEEQGITLLDIKLRQVLWKR